MIWDGMHMVLDTSFMILNRLQIPVDRMLMCLDPDFEDLG